METIAKVSNSKQAISKPDSIRPFAVTFLVFAIMLFGANIYAEISNALVFYRTILTIWVSIALLAPASFLYISGRDNHWSRWLWTFALLAYLVHFYFAFGETHGFSFASVYAKQGWFTATYNFFITVAWMVFTVLLWRSPGKYAVLKHVFVVLLLAGMLVASIGLKEGVVTWLGYILLAAIVAGAIARIRREPVAA
jgi:hypothetical protein